jgi:ribosome-binding protein aMBF1 (putative translation factor)
MITNERQLKITRSQAAQFEKTLAELENRKDEPTTLSPLLQQAQRNALSSQLESLRAEISEYESLKAGRQRVFEVASFAELPQTLIKARIAQGMTQKDLAERLGLKEQQIQRYEGTGYASASLQRVQQVIEALQVQVSERVSLSG